MNALSCPAKHENDWNNSAGQFHLAICSPHCVPQVLQINFAWLAARRHKTETPVVLFWHGGDIPSAAPAVRASGAGRQGCCSILGGSLQKAGEFSRRHRCAPCGRFRSDMPCLVPRTPSRGGHQPARNLLRRTRLPANVPTGILIQTAVAIRGDGLGIAFRVEHAAGSRRQSFRTVCAVPRTPLVALRLRRRQNTSVAGAGCVKEGAARTARGLPRAAAYGWLVIFCQLRPWELA